jgi:MFS family permease
VAIPKITDDFHGVGKISWYGAAYLMTFGGFQSTWGKFFKYFPLKASFLLSIAIFQLGSLICAVATAPIPFIVGRAIEGVGGAGIATGTFTIIALTTEPQLRPMFNGLAGATFGISAMVAPILGGVFAEKATWRWW